MTTPAEALAIAIQHHQAGQLPAAEMIYRQLVASDPNQPEPWHLLGVIAHQIGQHQLGVEYISQAIRLNGRESTYHNNLGEAYTALGNFSAAITCYRRALELKPSDAEVQYNLGNALRDQGDLTAAEACYHLALASRPNYAEAHNNLGNVLKYQGNIDTAYTCFRRAIALKPDYSAAHNNLGNALIELRNPDAAVPCFQRALELAPNYPEAHNNLGYALKDLGQIDAAITCFRQAINLNPAYQDAYSNLLFAQLFSPKVDARTLYQEHVAWYQRVAEPLTKNIEPHANDRSPQRRLRIGYVSADFREHIVGRNMLPLFREHDPQQFEIVGYYSNAQADAMTARLRSHTDLWRDVSRVNDANFAAQIRADRIDILVDLSLHSAGNRLLTFAMKPAPIQVTFAGYPGTTGLPQIDYRLTDIYLDPVDSNDQYYAEKSWRLADSFWCYDPLEQEQRVQDLPALTNGHITFGCLNNLCKINEDVLHLWAAVLNANPTSHLLLLAPCGSPRERIGKFFQQQGIDPERIEFAAYQPRLEYLKLYHQVDIGLDTFPYNGHTTSLDSYWMGVPVVTLVGSTVVGRAGYCQLQNLHMPEWIAQSPAEFVRIATDFAGDLGRLQTVRATLRQRMEASPLMDARRFTRNIETAYRQMWQKYCQLS